MRARVNITTPQPPPDPSDADYYSISGSDFGASAGFLAEHENVQMGSVFAPKISHQRHNIGQEPSTYGYTRFRFFAGVHLPHGSRIWGWRSYIYQGWSTSSVSGERIGYPGSCIVWLCEHNPSKQSAIAVGDVQTATFVEGPISLSIKPHRVLWQAELSHLVNNKDCTYFLRVEWPFHQSAAITFQGATIIYQKD